MSKIAIKLDGNRDITSYTPYPYSMIQDTNNGWMLVEDNPAFSINESFKWTVRESDGLLVHKSTGMTPNEETKALLVTLTKSQLKDQLMNDQIQQAVTSVTKQAIQDKLTSQMAITELTKQVANLTAKLDKANEVDSAPETPTEVTSTATTSGANVTAK